MNVQKDRLVGDASVVGNDENVVAGISYLDVFDSKRSVRVDSRLQRNRVDFPAVFPPVNFRMRQAGRRALKQSESMKNGIHGVLLANNSRRFDNSQRRRRYGPVDVIFADARILVGVGAPNVGQRQRLASVRDRHIGIRRQRRGDALYPSNE